MPTRADIEFATPLCRSRVLERKGQHGVHFTCFRPMRYELEANRWVCPTCGSQEDGGVLAARLRGWREEKAA